MVVVRVVVVVAAAVVVVAVIVATVAVVWACGGWLAGWPTVGEGCWLFLLLGVRLAHFHPQQVLITLIFSVHRYSCKRTRNVRS